MTQPPGPPYGQPQSGPPQYGQPPVQYSQPGGQPGGQPYGQQQGYGAPPVYRQPAGNQFGIVGAIVAVIGAALVVVAFTAVGWFKGKQTKFSDVKDLLDQAGSSGSGVSKLYFSWLAWVVLAVVFVVAILANLPSPSASPLRPLGLVLGLAAIGLTFWAIKFLSTSKPSYTEYLKNARLGFYFTLAGFLIIGIGAAIGSRSRSRF
jgi:hypothetical protein